MKVLHAFNIPRSGSGSTAASLNTIAALRQHHGVEVEVFSRSSRELSAGLAGRLKAGVSAFYPAEAVAAFDRCLARFAPDLVHVNELFPLVSPWVIRRCEARGIPVVMTIDDYHPSCPTRNHYRNGAVCTECVGGREWRAVVNNCRSSRTEMLVNAGYNLMVRRAGLLVRGVAQYIAPSDFTGQWAVRHAGLADSRMNTVNPTIALPETAADAAQGRYIAFAGRFVPEKGVHVLIEAAALLGLPVKLSRNATQSVTIDLPPSVDVVVTQDRAELDAFYRGARMLALPSTWFDSFPTVGEESMAHGIPVVGARIGGIPEMVTDGVDGLLFEPGQAADLAAKAARLWHDDALASRFGSAARQKALARWSSRAHADAVMQVYSRALAGH